MQSTSFISAFSGGSQKLEPARAQEHFSDQVSHPTREGKRQTAKL